MNHPIISLFSGAGGMDLGFKNAGFQIVWANEYDKAIWKTYEYNFPETQLCKKSILLVQEEEIPECIGLVGGPPCQSFSEAGAKRGTKDARGQLFWEYIRILKNKKPLFFVAENVSGLLAQRHEKDLQSFIQSFEDANYNVDVQLYNTKNYGIAQDRERIIFVGYRKDLHKKFSGLSKNNEEKKLMDVIGGMPEEIGIKNGKKSTNVKLVNHEYMLGGFSSMFMSRNRVRNWNETSFTILATARQIPLHPQAPKMEKVEKDIFRFVMGKENLYRRLSVRECARIQTFPDTHVFQYSKIEDGYKMVGNAVPVELAQQIANVICDDLDF